MLTAGKSVSDGLFLEDLHVGQRFSSGSHMIDEAQIKAFAAQFDPQPFHLDGEVAKASLFGGLAASGWHTAAITMKLLVESGLPLAAGIIGLLGARVWPGLFDVGNAKRLDESRRANGSETGKAKMAAPATAIDDNAPPPAHTLPSARRVLKVLAVGLLLWLLPFIALTAWRAGDVAAARRWFDMIMTDNETPSGTRTRIEMLMALADAAGKG